MSRTIIVFNLVLDTVFYVLSTTVQYSMNEPNIGLTRNP
jgi:hypothetical protein